MELHRVRRTWHDRRSDGPTQRQSSYKEELDEYVIETKDNVNKGRQATSTQAEETSRSLIRKRSHPHWGRVRSLLRENATVLDWPTSPGGKFRLLRAGTNGRTCLPGFPRSAHDEPGCFDQVFLQFIKDSVPVSRPMCRVMEFHTCMVASGYLTSPTRWKLAMNSTLGHTS